MTDVYYRTTTSFDDSLRNGNVSLSYTYIYVYVH